MTNLCMNFSGRSALITGAASGIGAATARLLEAGGIGTLVLVDSNAALLNAGEYSCTVQRFCGDVADPALWQTIATAVPQLDHAVLNAGIAGNGATITEMAFADWQRTLATNLDGVFLGLKLAMERLAAQGGSVVLTASVAAVRGVSSADYGASKAAVVQLAKIAAREGGPLGIRVNAIAPGGVDTPIWDQAPRFADQVARYGSRAAAITEFGKLGTPLGRFASADEIARHIGFLLSDLSAMITGTVVVADGGFSI